MKHIVKVFALVLVVMLLTPVVQASMKINLIEVPDGSVTVEFTPTKGAPAAGVKADLSYKQGQSRIDMHLSGKHQPAVLYGGDITCYVLWALQPDGTADNLGELRVIDGGLSHQFRTPSKRFALIITAEPYSLVRRPSDMVVFSNNPPEKKGVNWKAVNYDQFARASNHTNSSITGMEYKQSEPIDLIQARKAFELAGQNEADTYAPKLYGIAASELEMAEGMYAKGNKGDKLRNSARSSIDASAQAIHIATSTMAAELLSDVIAERQARMANLEERSEADELVIAELMARKADLEDEVGILSQELQDALSTVADTRVNAAGVVLTLPDILFKTNEATLLKGAEISLAKLAGIMLVFPRVQASIGGYTDSTGNQDHNLDLSLKRSEAVMAFLSDQGVDPIRLSAVGFGAADPIADNSTAEGRTQNRRVEIMVVAGDTDR